MGRKTGDQYVVPVCHKCHMEIHAFGDETTWWALRGIEPTEYAEDSWKRWREK